MTKGLSLLEALRNRAFRVELIEALQQRAFRSRAAARYLGVEEHTLTRYVKQGLIKQRHHNGQKVYFREDLDAFLDGLPVCENPNPQPNAGDI